MRTRSPHRLMHALLRRRRCCGVRWTSLHRTGCSRHPWAARLP